MNFKYFNSLIMDFKVIFLSVLLSLSLSHSETLKCHYLFDSELSYQGVSMHYSPALIENGRINTYDYHVYIEKFNAGSDKAIGKALNIFMDPVTYMILPSGKTYFHDAGLQAIYKSYGTAINPEIINQVILSEKKLPLTRQSTFIARPFEFGKELDKEAYGFIRIFDGSVHHKGILSYSKLNLPLENILTSMGKKTEIVDLLRSNNQIVFEIGKYYIDRSLDSKTRKSVKIDIFNWLIKYIESRGSNSVLARSHYFAHVASLAHEKAYRETFGFQIVDRTMSQGLEPQENILIIDGKTLLEKLKILKADLVSEK